MRKPSRRIFSDYTGDYLRVGWDEDTGYKIMEIEVEGVSKESLYEDWNKGIDKYGVIKGS